MTTPKKALTDTFIKNLKFSTTSKPISDSNGLFILAQKKGKVWIYSYINPKTGKRSTKNRIGYYPQMGLAEARQKRDELNSLVKQGIDPFEYLEKQQREAEQKQETLESFAYKWADWKLSKKKCRPETMAKCLQRLKNHLFPRFEGYTLSDFNLLDSINRLTDLEQIKPDTLHRIAGNLIEILDYAVLCGRIAFNPVSVIKKAFATVTHNHQPAITPDELAEFLQDLQKSNRMPETKLLVEWQLLNILRSFEACAVQWSDIDWEANTLTIPAERMKGGKNPHTIPLTRQALAILEEMKKYNGHCKHIFRHRTNPNKPASRQTVNNAIKRLSGGKYQGNLVAHGLRSIGATYLHERFTTEKEVVEACLSHIDRASVKNRYHRDNGGRLYLDRRREIMQEWADFVEKCKKG
ncbi:tyrosine-type recombinase/integrase [Mannheimia varigena]|uniref:tyrosine-type recombinase/integrase n=1 Tax=Mannheimia varigena TaxID=85404 RepID=UPI0015B4D9A3|nr:tyrosine-type recombinase/integrase [Mannheimia varigena]QLD32995.1 tyrosine-type recombinase/integrase [Mannheimia varigena]